MRYTKLYAPQERSAATGEPMPAPGIEKARVGLFDQFYQEDTTRALVALVKEAAELVRVKGEAAFAEFRVAGSRWRQGETYIFVLDPQGNMLVHSDQQLEGKNQLELKDINGKPIIRGLLNAATAVADKPEGWYHYEWPVPEGLLPRWKSSYVRQVKAPSGKSYIVGSGMYNDRMEREFVVDAVKDAVAAIEKNREAAFALFRDPTGPYRAKDAYIFVVDPNGVELVNPAFPNLEGRNLLDVKDTRGKLLVRDMLQTVQTSGSGWVDYMWPKPGESVSTQKSTYVSKARVGDGWLLVGCGVYLADAPKTVATTKKMTAPELMALVRAGAALLEQQGEQAYTGFRQQGTRWFRDDTYLFVWTLDGTRIFNAATPATEGQNERDMKDVLGRPVGRMLLEAATSPAGEGWVHYMWPEPGNIFPAWKSSFVKRVTFPSGKQYLVGSGIYNMQMDKAFIEDMVNRAATLITERGKDAFALLRDRTGPYVFMDTYVFVDDLQGTELVNGAQPSLEGKNLIKERDARGKLMVRDYLEAAVKNEQAWVDYYWYKPGQNEPTHKYAYVRKVQHGGETYVVGAGIYATEDEKRTSLVRKMAWKTIDKEKMSNSLSRQVVFGEKGTLAQFSAKRGSAVERHAHHNEEYLMVLSGTLRFIFDDREEVVHPGEILLIPANVPHAIEVLQDAVFQDFFAPVREDWLRGKDQYLRQEP